MLNHLILWHKFFLLSILSFNCGIIINTDLLFHWSLLFLSFFIFDVCCGIKPGISCSYKNVEVIFSYFYVLNILLYLKSVNMILFPQLLFIADLQVMVSDSLVCSCDDLNRKTTICYWNGYYWLRRVALLRKGDLETKTSLSLTSGHWTMICLEIKISPL